MTRTRRTLKRKPTKLTRPNVIYRHGIERHQQKSPLRDPLKQKRKTHRKRGDSTRHPHPKHNDPQTQPIPIRSYRDRIPADPTAMSAHSPAVVQRMTRCSGSWSPTPKKGRPCLLACIPTLCSLSRRTALNTWLLRFCWDIIARGKQSYKKKRRQETRGNTFPGQLSQFGAPASPKLPPNPAL